MTTLDVVAVANVKDTLSLDDADRAVDMVIRTYGHRPELLGLLEWNRSRGVPPCIKHTTLRYARSVAGGSPVVYDSTRYTLLKSKTKTLALGGFVGRLPGRRSTLGPSLAAIYRFVDELGGPDTVVILAHLTAEVQKGKRYRIDVRHHLRVIRHKLERLHLSNLVRRYWVRGLRVYVLTDTNFDGMKLPPLISCWVDHDGIEAKGSLGNRTVDYVFGRDKAATVRMVPTPSDHDAVVATYFRKDL